MKERRDTLKAPERQTDRDRITDRLTDSQTDTYVPVRHGEVVGSRDDINTMCDCALAPNMLCACIHAFIRTQTMIITDGQCTHMVSMVATPELSNRFIRMPDSHNAVQSGYQFIKSSTL